MIGEDVKTEIVKTDDNRSYHISSEKIKKVLGFSAKKTIEDAVRDLKYAFDHKILKNTLIEKNFLILKE